MAAAKYFAVWNPSERSTAIKPLQTAGKEGKLLSTPKLVKIVKLEAEEAGVATAQWAVRQLFGPTVTGVTNEAKGAEAPTVVVESEWKTS